VGESFPLDVETMVRAFNHLNVGVYITDPDRRIVLWNRKAEEITGWLAEDIVGSRCHDNILNHINPAGLRLCFTDFCPLHRAMQLGKASREPALVYARKADGGRVPLSVTAAPLRDGDGTIIGAIETFRDESSRMTDMEFAKRIQLHLMPKELPRDESLQFDARYAPLDLVGGDFYDIRRLEPNRYSFMVADVAGHGVSASLYTMLLKSMEEDLEGLSDRPAELLTQLNRRLRRFVVDSSFASVFYGVVDGNHGRVIYANAGHPPPLHFHARDRTITELQSRSLPLGVEPETTYRAGTAMLRPGDLLFCYTDGASDVVDTEGQRLRAVGLSRLLGETIAANEGSLLGRLYESLVRMSGDVTPTDDVLLVTVARRR